MGAGDEVPFPMARYGAVLDLGWTLGDHDHGVHEPWGSLFAGGVGFTPGPAGPQRGLHLAFESASGLEVEGLIDRLWAHAHLRVVGKLFDQRVADLFRRP